MSIAPPLVVGVTGASGAVYAVRLLQVLVDSEFPVHLTISASGAAVIHQELGLKLDLENLDVNDLLSYVPPWETSGNEGSRWNAGGSRRLELAQANLRYDHHGDFLTPMASGSFLTTGMVICPCSGSTLSGISRAAASNLVMRAAEVHLKEHRKLVLVPRETPMSSLQIENMQRIASAGGVVLPAMPGWYHGVKGLTDLVDFIVGRILDQFQIENVMIRRWGTS